jgi:hypothetical protein
MSADRLVKLSGVRLAQRFTRRSLLGRTAVTATALGAAGYGLSSTAEAHTPPSSCQGLSVRCDVLFGTNRCPTYTCLDGWWTTSSGPCSGTTYWQDCCVASSNCPGGCHCTHGANSCCSHCPYGVNCTGVVRCRRYFC